MQVFARSILFFSLISAAAGAEPDRDGFYETVVPFVKAHCYECHGQTDFKGKFSFSRIDINVVSGKDQAKWRVIADVIESGDMPPEDEKQPSDSEKEAMLAWINAELSKGGQSRGDIARQMAMPQHGNRVPHEQLFRPGGGGVAASPERMWRLSPEIYAAFADRITKRRTEVSQAFSTSPGEGFKDYADLFVIDEPTISQLLRNARKLVDYSYPPDISRNKNKEVKPLFENPTRANKEMGLKAHFRLVLRRNPTDEELDRFIDLMDRNIEDAGEDVGIRMTLATVYLLPEALYRMEFGEGPPGAGGKRMLGPRAIAEAVGYALMDDGPDQQLLDAAANGDLKTKEDVRRQIERIWVAEKLKRPRIMRFFDEYFGYPHAYDVFKDVERGDWRADKLVDDTRRLIQHILDEDRDVLFQLLTTNKSFVNYGWDGRKKIAQPAFVANKRPTDNPKTEIHEWYGLPADWKWTAEQPIELPKLERAGILLQPSWLGAHATNNENHAILRGKWVRERLLGGTVPDLPITVDAQLPDAPHETLRERMKITNDQYCWRCHQRMNPLGLAFEQFDYLGRYRTMERVVNAEAEPQKDGKPVYHDVELVTAGLIRGSGDPKLEGPVENSVYMMHKLARSERVRQVFVRHAFRYWMGRNETLDDSTTLIEADQAYVASEGSFKELVISLLTSDSFLYRKPPSSS